MPSSGASNRKLPLLPIAVGAFAILGLAGAAIYLSRPGPKPPDGSSASAEARAYLRNLDLKDVTMKATENFMQQQVVEVEGSISNNGPRPLQSIVVYCLFYGVDSREMHRERVPLLQSKTPLQSGETRHFRLPFDNLPQGWNQALPKMVIAQIDFAP